MGFVLDPEFQNRIEILERSSQTSVGDPHSALSMWSLQSIVLKLEFLHASGELGFSFAVTHQGLIEWMRASVFWLWFSELNCGKLPLPLGGGFWF